jgi:tetracycline repressor-like protein
MANKDDVLDGMVDYVVSEINDVVGRIDLPATEANWKNAIRRRILAARQVLLRHPWAPPALQRRTTVSMAVLRYHDELVRLMREGGFSNDVVHHALHALGSRAVGFAQELFDPGESAGSDPGSSPEDLASQFPHLAVMLTEVAHDDPDSTIGWCDDQTEFEFGLDLILDGLDRLRDRP